ncbi:MAG: hypothetical protein CVU42_02890 [Chloroflexi bacterium HGW-Chloroflexi-4]|jgi:FkbM family methyltransferase|nr:MAG: hypothetical protein CVU42_02890 [Chloroflexi bacterium HGW-Chloroflexi-4]
MIPSQDVSSKPSADLFIEIRNRLLAPPYKDVLKIKEFIASLDGQSSGLIVNIEGVDLLIKSVIDVHLISNIYIQKVYDYLFTEPTIVVDIGANVGYSAIWFAKNDFVKKVYAFEPVKPTYDQALESVQLNPSFSNKVDFRNIGVSDRNQTSSILYFKDHHTISSVLFTDPRKITTSGKPPSSVTIDLVNAKTIFDEIITYQDQQNCRMVMKIDCEGSEYAIFDKFDTKIWNAIDVILMEVHGEHYRDLLKKLAYHGFEVFSINHQKHQMFGHLCDVYAIKSYKNKQL